MIHDGSVKLEKVNYQEVADSKTFVMGSDAAEFANKVKDQVRKRQKRMSNVGESGEEHSIIWGMFMVATMNAATFMEEINCLDKILWGKNSWTRLSLIDEEIVINLQSTKSMSSRILCCASERFFNILNATKLGRTVLQEPEPRKATEIMTVSMESRPNSSGIFSQGSQRCSSAVKSVIC